MTAIFRHYNTPIPPFPQIPNCMEFGGRGTVIEMKTIVGTLVDVSVLPHFRSLKWGKEGVLHESKSRNARCATTFTTRYSQFFALSPLP
jgi:hypothetical protein